MTLAPSATDALALTAVVAVLALVTRLLTPGGAFAGLAVGACVSLGFGLPGLAALGSFFAAGTAATRVGWATKQARGTAEAGGGRRDAARVLGKGAVPALVGLLVALRAPALGAEPALPFVGSVAAALADTLGSEIGKLARGAARTLPRLRPVPVGTPGAVTALGTLATAAGAAIVAGVAHAVGLLDPHEALVAADAGFLGAMLESLAVGLGLGAPGWARNLLTTGAGALLARMGAAL